MNPLQNNSPFNGPLTPTRFRATNPQSQHEEPPAQSSSISKARFVPIILGAIVLLALPVTIWQINSQQDLRQQASNTQPLTEQPIARVGNTTITKADIDREYTKQQNATTYTTAPSALQSELLDEVIRKRIITLEAEKRKITVSDQEISNKMDLLETLSRTVTVNRELAKDLVLAEKIAAIVSPSRTAHIVFSNDIEAETRSFFESLKENSLESTLSETVNSPIPQSQNLHFLEDIMLTQSNIFLSPLQTEEVFLLEVGDVSNIFENNKRFFLIQIQDATEGEYGTFAEFLNARKAESVKLLTQ